MGAEKVNSFFGTGRDRTGKDTGQIWGAELGRASRRRFCRWACVVSGFNKDARGRVHSR